MIEAPIHMKVARMICENLIVLNESSFDIIWFINQQNIHKNHIEKTLQILNKYGISTLEGALTDNYKEKCFELLRYLFFNDDLPQMIHAIKKYQISYNEVITAIQNSKQ
jgi:hypothetical protein